MIPRKQCFLNQKKAVTSSFVMAFWFPYFYVVDSAFCYLRQADTVGYSCYFVAVQASFGSTSLQCVATRVIHKILLCRLCRPQFVAQHSLKYIDSAQGKFVSLDRLKSLRANLIEKQKSLRSDYHSARDPEKELWRLKKNIDVILGERGATHDVPKESRRATPTVILSEARSAKSKDLKRKRPEL